MENNQLQQSFWQFSDQLRDHIQTPNLSLNDSIWSNNFISKITTTDHQTTRRTNFDIKVGGEINNNSWKQMNNTSSCDQGSVFNNMKGGGIGLNGGFNKGIDYLKPSSYGNFNLKAEDEVVHHPIPIPIPKTTTSSKKNLNKKDHNNNDTSNKKNNNSKDAAAAAAADKRFKTLPASESLPRNETIGGYIFVCNNDTMAENLKRQLFGLPPRYRDSVRAITPGLPLFLYNYTTHQLHGIFEAASFGGSNIDPTAWEDKKCYGESRFPAQVRVITRKTCDPLQEDSFRPILHHYDGPKFRLELNVPEALSLLDIFTDQDSFKDSTTSKAIPSTIIN